MEAIIEVGTSDCVRDVFCEPLGESLRGKFWVGGVKGVVLDDGTARLPDVPGMRIALDAQKRRVRVFDPLETERGGRKTLSEIDEARRHMPIRSPGKAAPVEERIFEGLTENQVAHWAQWMDTQVKAKHATLVSGTIPAMKPHRNLSGYVCEPGTPEPLDPATAAVVAALKHSAPQAVKAG